jgi:hypothetical protein
MRQRTGVRIVLFLGFVGLAGCGGSARSADLPPGTDASPDHGTEAIEDIVPGDEAAAGPEDLRDPGGLEAGPDPGPDGNEPFCDDDDDCAGKLPGLAPCRVARCVDGKCQEGLADDATPCDDTDPCTSGETCSDGACGKGKPTDCDDKNPCTLDLCSKTEGCGHAPVTGPCDDGTQCTENDACAGTTCTGTAVACDDGNPCTTDGCDPATGCTHEPLGSGPCDDHSACTLDDRCVAGLCKGDLLDCGDGNVCTLDTCEPKEGCRHDPAPGKCDDGKNCTQSDTCVDGACQGVPFDCDDGDPCTDDLCEEGPGCVHVPNSAPCDDLNPCTAGDVCHGGSCSGQPIACNDAPASTCTGDGSARIVHSLPGVCSGGTCEYVQQIVPCSQGCADGLCLGVEPCTGVDCSKAPSACFETPGTCVDGTCRFGFRDGIPCDDGLACTAAETCHGGVCAGGPVACHSPPPDTCDGGKHLKAWKPAGSCGEPEGNCTYSFELTECAGGCVDGVCLDTLGLLQAGLTPAGAAGLTDGTHELSCAMPGWLPGEKAESGVYLLQAGFEP